MKRIIAFIILVILVIVMIVLSYNFYSGNSSKKAKKSLSNGITVVEKKKDTNNSSSSSNSNSNSTSDNNTSNSTNTTEANEVTVQEDADVPDTASDSNDDYIAIDHYSVSCDKTTMKVGDTSNIHVKVYPSNASEREVSYSSSNSDIVKVNSFGKMSALKSGEVSITVSVKNAKDYTFVVNVK